MGKMHMFNLGQALRERYGHFLGSGYENNELKVMSSAVERCIMSAQAMLAGMMPPSMEQRLNPDLNWQPFPVHYLRPEQDALVLKTKPCPRYDLELNVVMSSPEMEELNKMSRNIYEYLSEYTGVNVSDTSGALDVYDTLVSQQHHGLEIPTWAEPVADTLQFLAARSRSLYTKSDVMKRLRGGPMLNEILLHMSEKRSDPNNPSGKMYLYSVNEQTIYDLLKSMGFTDLMEVDFGSCVIFELHHDKERDKWTVLVMYYNFRHLPIPRALSVPGCEEQCDLETFMQLLIPVIPQNFEEECQVQK